MSFETVNEIPPWEWTEDMGKQLLGVLVDPLADPADRLIAAELAGDLRVVDDDLAEALLAILQDASETNMLRCEAGISLGPAIEHADLMAFDEDDDIGISKDCFQRIQVALEKLYRDASVPSEVRRRVLEAAVYAPQEWQHRAVRAAYLSDDEAWKLTAVFCMRFLRGFEEQIFGAFGHADPEMLYQAVRAAGNWELTDAWPQIVAFVTSPETDKLLRLAAIDAAAVIRPEIAAEVIEPLTRDRDEDIVDAAYEALAIVDEILGEG